MPATEYRICVDCQEKVAKWFTTHTDKDPRCDRCATAKFKRDHPATWNLKTKTSIFPIIGP